VTNTVIFDFKQTLLVNGIISNEILEKPWILNPYLLFFLTSVSIQKIMYFDLLLVILLEIIVIFVMQFRYILVYFKSKLQAMYKETIKDQNPTLFDFTAKIQKNKLLHYLFILFIVFLLVDILIVTFNSIIRPFNDTLPNLSEYVIVKIIISLVNQSQTIEYLAGLFYLLILFVGVLIIFNIVSLKLHETQLSNSFSGIAGLFSVNLLIILSFLIYDLQNYRFEPLKNFNSFFISSEWTFGYDFFIKLVTIGDITFFIIVLLYILTFITKKFNENRKNDEILPEIKEEESGEGEVIN
jgi:hypothetical protein